jgi:YHS domain-containing protein
MTSIELRQHDGAPHTREWRRGTLLHVALLACGIVATIMYVAVDLFAASRFPGYSLVDQVISELSAIGAPTANYWSAMGPAYELLMLAFGIGVLREAGGNRRLRVTGAMLVAFSVFGVLWAFFPMHQRGAAMTWTDVGHIVLGVATVSFFLTLVAFGASTLGRRFRVYSLVTLAVLLLSGIATFAMTPRLIAGEATPFLGVVERINVYGSMLWVAVLGIALLGRQRSLHGSRITSPTLERKMPAYGGFFSESSLMPGVIDPVCGMTIDSQTAVARTRYEGRTVYFCSEECKQQFEANPSRYAATALADEPERLERHEPPFTKSGGWVAPKFGSAGSGGAEYERLPEAHDKDNPR